IPAARKGGETDLLLELCRKLLQDEEPYVQKAIGWSLKELCKGDMDAVIGFLQAHGDAMPASTLRYACERMTDAERALARRGA
ncbi:MAG: DNA alkylation repair protein, partial [Anaerolineae bacterium]|nr:DNA alkylation repair protein [Anaerolineae bacterium]